MSAIFQIDTPSLINEQEDEDLIKIKLKNDDIIEIKYSKLVNQSKYIRDKYKYSEAIYSIQTEIEYITNQMKINDNSIKFFIQFIHEEKVAIPIEYYRDIYILSEYFNTSILTKELNKISNNELFSDLNFTLQMLIDFNSNPKEIESKFGSDIEKFLAIHINECFQNPKLNEIPIAVIYRILQLSDKSSIDSKLLIDFILNAIDFNFPMFRFIELHKLSEYEIEKLFKFIEDKPEYLKKVYLEYMPFDLKYINQVKSRYNQMKNEFEQMKEEFNQMKEEHKQIKQIVNQTKKMFKRINQELNQTKDELENAKQELNQTKDEFKQRQNMFKQFILVGGLNSDNRLGENPNNKSVDGNSFISPPLKSSLDPFSLLSYSVYYHSVIITKRYSLQGIGDNCKGAICKALEKAEVGQFTEFSIRDERISQFVPVSAVTTAYGTLYMFSNSNGSMKQLIYCDEGIDGGMPVFLNIENQLPIALFGGFSYVAAISIEGKIIFINRWSIKYSPQSSIAAISLPNGDKASSIAFCNDSVIVLSSNGKLFSSSVVRNSTSLEFSIVEELKNEDIINLSGTYYHCLAVNKEGIVFALGTNED